MELKLILILARRWAWLLILGLLLGGAGAYFVSQRQQPIYVASTKILVTQAPRSSVAEVQVLNERDLTQTYIELLVTRPVIEETSERLGFNVHSSQISARRIGSTGLLEVTVRDALPGRAADIANEVVEVLISRNEAIQTSLFASTEESLQAQIAQVEEQMSVLQNVVTEESEESREFRLEQLRAELTTVEDTIYTLQSEISQIEVQIEVMMPPATVGSPAPTLSTREQDLLSALRTEVAQKRFQLGLAQDQYRTLAARLADGGETATRSSQPQATLALYQQIYSNLLSSYEAVRLARLQNTAHVVQVEAAVSSSRPIQSDPVRNILLGAALGLIVMGGIAFLIEYLDDTLKTPLDIQRVLGLPVIGRILAFSNAKKKQESSLPFVYEHRRSVQAEAFRALHTNLEFAGTERPLKTILFTSILPGEGKSTVVMNLATAMANAQQQIVVLDCDLRRPSLHLQLGSQNRLGMGEYLSGQKEVEDVARYWPRGDGGLTVVTSGAIPRYPTESLRSDRINEMLDYMKDRADFVLIDSPPMVVADAAVLASRVDGVILVMQPGRANAETANTVVEQLNRLNARIVGVVLTRVADKKSPYRDLRDSYSSYYDTQNLIPTMTFNWSRGIKAAWQRIWTIF